MKISQMDMKGDKQGFWGGGEMGKQGGKTIDAFESMGNKQNL